MAAILTSSFHLLEFKFDTQKEDVTGNESG